MKCEASRRTKLNEIDETKINKKWNHIECCVTFFFAVKMIIEKKKYNNLLSESLKKKMKNEKDLMKV